MRSIGAALAFCCAMSPVAAIAEPPGSGLRVGHATVPVNAAPGARHGIDYVDVDWGLDLRFERDVVLPTASPSGRPLRLVVRLQTVAYGDQADAAARFERMDTILASEQATRVRRVSIGGRDFWFADVPTFSSRALVLHGLVDDVRLTVSLDDVRADAGAADVAAIEAALLGSVVDATAVRRLRNAAQAWHYAPDAPVPTIAGTIEVPAAARPHWAAVSIGADGRATGAEQLINVGDFPGQDVELRLSCSDSAATAVVPEGPLSFRGWADDEVHRERKLSMSGLRAVRHDARLRTDSGTLDRTEWVAGGDAFRFGAQLIDYGDPAVAEGLRAEIEVMAIACRPQVVLDLFATAQADD